MIRIVDVAVEVRGNRATLGYGTISCKHSRREAADDGRRVR